MTEKVKVSEEWICSWLSLEQLIWKEWDEKIFASNAREQFTREVSELVYAWKILPEVWEVVLEKSIAH